MDSKLVVEQMSGRWQIKHPGLRPLAARGRRSWSGAFDRVTFTWIPRERNKHADALANQAMDARGRACRSVRTTAEARVPLPRGRRGPRAAPPGCSWSATARPR